MPDEQLRRSLGEIAYQGSELAAAFADRASASSTSTFGVMANLHSDRNWDPGDIRFLSEATRALVAVAGAQLHGAGDVLVNDPKVHLHPLVTLLRGIAEAAGRIWWFFQHLLPEPDEDADLTLDEWVPRAERVLYRSQLARLDALAERRARTEASHGGDSEQYRSVQDQLQAYKQQLIATHSEQQLNLRGGRKAWRIHGEGFPPTTELVIAATEYAYGEKHRGSGLNPYRMYSGYAHASIELVFAHADASTRPPISTLIIANNDEVRRLGGATLRAFAVAYELASHMYGADLTTFHEWEGRADDLVIEREAGAS